MVVEGKHRGSGCVGDLGVVLKGVSVLQGRGE